MQVPQSEYCIGRWTEYETARTGQQEQINLLHVSNIYDRYGSKLKFEPILRIFFFILFFSECITTWNINNLTEVIQYLFQLNDNNISDSIFIKKEYLSFMFAILGSSLFL